MLVFLPFLERKYRVPQNLLRLRCKEIFVIEIVSVDECKDSLNKRWEWNWRYIWFTKMSLLWNSMLCSILHIVIVMQYLLINSNLFGQFLPVRKMIIIPIIVSRESYYAVFFDKTYYIGRVVNISWLGKSTLKCLHSCGNNSYNWPKRDDISTAEKSFIFMGLLKIKIDWQWSFFCWKQW